MYSGNEPERAEQGSRLRLEPNMPRSTRSCNVQSSSARGTHSRLFICLRVPVILVCGVDWLLRMTLVKMQRGDSVE